MFHKEKAIGNSSVLFVLLLFAVEAFLFAGVSHGEFFRFRQANGIDVVISFIPAVIRGITFSVLFLTVFILLTNWGDFKFIFNKRVVFSDLWFQLINYLFLMLMLLMIVKFNISGWYSVFYSLLFVFVWIFFIISSILIFIDLGKLINIITGFKYVFFIGVVLVFLDQISVVYSMEIEGYFHTLLFKPTASLSKYLLEVMGYQVLVDENLFKITLDNFSGEIAAVCLGYQGAFLGFLFLSGYLFALRKDFRFPRVLIVLPLAVVALWLLNSVRIAFLLAIGSSWSEEIAVNGFHRVGGWINLIGVSSLMLFVLHRTAWLSAINRPSTVTLSINKENVLLMPQLTLIGTTLIAMLFTGQFDWLYPIKILIVGFVLIYTCRQMSFKLVMPDIVTILLGLFVFIVWMMVVPDSPEKNAEFSIAISKAPDTFFYVWVLFRVIGAVVVVPLSEELAFRGFVVNRLRFFLSRSIGEKIRFILAGLISSLIFGLLHDAWMAGTVAGFVFYYAMNRRSNISDAVVVHGIANLLISMYVLTTQQWSYW